MAGGYGVGVRKQICEDLLGHLKKYPPPSSIPSPFSSQQFQGGFATVLRPSGGHIVFLQQMSCIKKVHEVQRPVSLFYWQLVVANVRVVDELVLDDDDFDEGDCCQNDGDSNNEEGNMVSVRMMMKVMMTILDDREGDTDSGTEDGNEDDTEGDTEHDDGREDES
ncbi:hypothetical protein BDZ91DRAFT_762206 [Kalaharituber pfeilii]|nr:hypothetical protein BDZ91DRAFT_762206 [Kalaharituber pfeilii]